MLDRGLGHVYASIGRGRYKLGLRVPELRVVARDDSRALPAVLLPRRLHEGHCDMNKTPFVLRHWTPLVWLLRWCPEHDSFHWFGHLGSIRHP